MEFFNEYQLSQRAARGHFQLTQRLGMAPLAISLIMMFAHRGFPAPGLWAALGLSVGLQLLLTGCHGICFARDIQTRAATYLALTSDGWFPLFLFSIQTGFMFVSMGLIWFTLLELGFPTTTWLQLNLATFLLTIPACRILADIARSTASIRWTAAAEACRYLSLVLAAIWIAGTLMLFMAPPDKPIPPDKYIFAIILWLLVALLALTCVMLFVDHLLHAEKE